MTEPCKCNACSSKTALTNDSVTASGFLTNEQLGPKQSFTPEGFLLCEDVVIARIGTQDYAAIELPDIEDKDGVIEVERSPEVVFSPETIASFLGKPVTIEHPSSGVTPTNWSTLAKGSTYNVRRGEGDQSDYLIADLLITDKGAIHEITSNRLREISCGYDADYEQVAPGRARQTTIVGNHVALVNSARCGPVCSVQDSKFIGGNLMAAKKGAMSFADKLRKIFNTRDSEALEKVLDEMPDHEGEGKDTHVHIHMPGAEKTEETKDDESEADPMAKIAESINALTQAVTTIGERVSALESGKTSDSEEEKKEETKDDDGDGDGEDDMTGDSDEEEKKDDEKLLAQYRHLRISDPDKEEKKDDEKKTNDSASIRNEFQDAKARAEILAPGIKLPTFDAKLDSKKTTDSICLLRRRALRSALEGPNADLVKAVTGDSDVSKLTCDSAKAFFNAASELIKRKNVNVSTVVTVTSEAKKSFADINKTHANFWANRK